MPKATVNLLFVADSVDSLFSIHSDGCDRNPAFGLSILAEGVPGFLWGIGFRGSGQFGDRILGCLLAGHRCPWAEACPCNVGSIFRSESCAHTDRWDGSMEGGVRLLFGLWFNAKNPLDTAGVNPVPPL